MMHKTRNQMGDETRVGVGGEEIRISSPDRVIFPTQGWTKLDVANHFALVAEGAIRGIFGRPTMLKRYMGTVDEDPIYHKRAAKNTPFETVQIRFPSQRPGMMNVPRTEGDVVRLVQLGCLDFHPWPVRAEDIDHPDELRFDFDPTPGFDFEKVKEAAVGMHSLLDEVGLVGWPKTSGSRGIHVYVRIEPLWDFFQTRRAVLAAARELERRMDGLVTTKWWKEERNGVFIDYNQNARDKSVCSAYGVRPTGFVSTPITWDELPDVAIQDFPLGSYADRYRQVGDLTAGIDDAPGRIDTLMEWVARDQENGIGDAPWPPHYPKMPDEPPRVQPSKQRRPTEDY
jgi:DNA ligase D-like protein (predicted polymerase)